MATLEKALEVRTEPSPTLSPYAYYDDVVRWQDQSTGGNGGLEEYKERLQSEQDAMKKTQEEANAQIEALKADLAKKEEEIRAASKTEDIAAVEAKLKTLQGQVESATKALDEEKSRSAKLAEEVKVANEKASGACAIL